MSRPHDRPPGATGETGADGGLAALLAARPDDVWLAHDVLPDRIERVWIDGAAVAWTSTHPLRDVRWLTAVGDRPAATAALLVRALEERTAAGVAVSGTTVDDDANDLLAPEHRAPAPDRWSWWWTDDPPAERPGESAVRTLDASDRRLAELLSHSASVYVLPGDARVRSWAGVERQGELLACGAHVQHVPGVPHLASVVTRPDHRGEGLAGDVCAHLTREALVAGFPVVTLGMYVGNDAAQRVYERLGFRRARVFASGYLPGMSPPEGVPLHDSLPADAGGTTS